MGTSMTVPDSVKERLARKIMEHQERVTANKQTLQAGKKMLNNLSKVSIQMQVGGKLSEKLKQQPQTAITQQNLVLSPKIDVQLQNIQIEIAAIDKLAQQMSNQPNIEEKQNNFYSIWQSMTQQTKNHFRRVDQRRKQSIKVNSRLSQRQDNIIQEAQNSCIIQKINKQKFYSDIYTDKANQLLSIDFKFGNNSNNKLHSIKQMTSDESNIKNQQKSHKIVKKILLPDVQIVKPFKEKRKLKYVYHDQEIMLKDRINWSKTS